MLPSSWKWGSVFLVLADFSDENKHHLFALSLKNRLQQEKIQIFHLVKIIYQKFCLDTSTGAFIELILQVIAFAKVGLENNIGAEL